MKKRSILSSGLVMAGCLLLLLTGCGKETIEPEAGYTEQELKLVSTLESSPDQIAVRFYEGTPNVPFIGMAQYKELVQDEKIKVEVDDGKLLLTSTSGATVTADPKADTLTSDRWAEFRNSTLEGHGDKVIGFRDTNAPFVKITSIEYEPQSGPVVFDLSEYDIPLYADETDVYLPLATVNDLMADIAQNGLVYNGENVYWESLSTSSMTDLDPEYYKSFAESTPRDEDMVEYAYNELCFVVDRLRCGPETSILSESISQKGLDKSLQETDDYTSTVRERLLSTDRDLYSSGLYFLTALLYDGFTMPYDSEPFGYLKEKDPEWFRQYIDDTTEILAEKDYSAGYLELITNRPTEVVEARETALGDSGTYHVKGDTAVIDLNDLTAYDEDGWSAYYLEGGEMPDGGEEPDATGTLLSGLKKAKDDPAIKNVVLDLSTNPGCYNDIMMTFCALLTGKADLRFYDRLTGQQYIIHYEVDSLFDGSFATSAAFDDMDLDLAVLVSDKTLSGGSTLTCYAAEAGIPILGERSGGNGAYMLTCWDFPEGIDGLMAYGAFLATDKDGNVLDDGTPADLQLVATSDDGQKDYSGLFDIDSISSWMNKTTR